MFGFERLGSLGRRFERAVQCDADDKTALVDGLCAAIESTNAEIHSRASQRTDFAVT
jgi:hypothetical protein